MKKNTILIFLLTLTSCWANPLGIIDKSVFKPITDKPGVEVLSGTYELDSLSYEFINSLNKFEKEPVTLNISINGHLRINNMPNALLIPIEANEWKRTDYEGTWRLSKDYQDTTEYVIEVNLDKLSTTFYLANFKNEIVIWNFVGDPDSGNRFLFKKKKQ
jgi:hypothetical protein